ncbi:hypothetical protein [Rhizobium ruizarguesonis]|jgi:hypothetical protein|uniref:hypothetical protein n=1 Tax=Rhizobium ruizarguesonis TaxID=2081791 RepID=UPI0010306135|nr:hypothetical protein [Rhizobium ruizarguesonis]MBY5850583.1 hypothetical protein [Rhizobium leguminosarum]MBY5891420.1 hypothetical protein [Rhizobium leguminosarum]QSY99606.1 hypothetical protein J3P73_17390 [Rhizobium ruizarguesonis]TAT79534.1 hypothetical protein ELI56_15645 [Rhizobium ruizarguesonis]TAT89517.1 hypothetical protein ELI54_15560 [Rhizobium ruizarguesonis]
MTTADWALIISLLSFCVSVAGFVWNVWSKFIFPKAKVQVHFSVNNLIQEWEPEDHQMLVLHATNFGPGEIILHMAIGRARPSYFKKLTHFILNPLHNFPVELDRTLGPFSGGLPKKIQPGESHSAYFVLFHEGLREQPIVDVGFSDTFGRSHWATRKQVAAVRNAVKDAYRKGEAEL